MKMSSDHGHEGFTSRMCPHRGTWVPGDWKHPSLEYHVRNKGATLFKLQIILEPNNTKVYEVTR